MPSRIKQSLSVDSVTIIKRLLWLGRTQEEVAAILGVSQSTVSRIRSGRRYGDIPWPDGSTGPLPEGQRSRVLQDWSDEARRFLDHPEEIQERILSIVNKRRAEEGRDPIPPRSAVYQDFLDSDPSDQVWEAAHLVEARRAEDRRLSQTMLEFESILLEEVALRSAEETASILEATRSEQREVDVHSKGTVETLTYDKLPWEQVKRLARNNPLVTQAVAEEDAVLAEAICIMFHELKGSPSSWGQPEVQSQIVKLAGRIRELPKLVEAIEGTFEKEGEGG